MGGAFVSGIPQSLAVTDVLSGSFSYTVQDGGGAQSSATVNFTVQGDNDAPTVAAPVAESFTEDDGIVTVDLLDGAADPDTNDTLNVTSLTVVSGNDGGVMVVGNSLSIDTDYYTSLAMGESEVIVYSYLVDLSLIHI